MDMKVTRSVITLEVARGIFLIVHKMKHRAINVISSKSGGVIFPSKDVEEGWKYNGTVSSLFTVLHIHNIPVVPIKS